MEQDVGTLDGGSGEGLNTEGRLHGLLWAFVSWYLELYTIEAEMWKIVEDKYCRVILKKSYHGVTIIMFSNFNEASVKGQVWSLQFELVYPVPPPILIHVWFCLVM